MDLRKVFEELRCFIDRHVQYVSDVFAFEMDHQGLSIEPLATAARTGDQQVAEEVHFDPFSTLTFA